MKNTKLEIYKEILKVQSEIKETQKNLKNSKDYLKYLKECFEDEKEDYVDRSLIVNYLKSFRQRSSKKLFEIRESLKNQLSFSKIR